MMVAAVATSCKKDKESPALSVDKQTVEAVATGGAYTVEVKSNGEWTAAVTPATATWCTVTPAKGNGNGTLTVSVEANATTTAQTATVTLTQGELIKTVAVTQEAGAATVGADKATIAATAGAGTYTLAVTANDAWTATVSPTDATWVTLSPASGNGNGTVTVTVEANPTTAVQTATITLASGAATQTVTVTQAGAGASLEVNTTPISVPAVDSYTGFDITGTVEWTITVSPPTATWCVVSVESGTGNGGFSLHAVANTAATTRTANVIVAGGGLTRTIGVTQAAAPVSLNLSTTSIPAIATASTYSVGVTSNIAWTAAVTPPSATWCTPSVLSGIGDGTVKTVVINVAANATASTRDATVTFTAGGVNQSITVRQSAAGATLSISPSEESVTFDKYGNRPNGAETATFAVTTNTGGWNVVSSQTWCTAAKSANNLVISVSTNNSVLSRTATVTVTATNAASITINITQASGLEMVRVAGGTFTMGNTGWTHTPPWQALAGQIPQTPTHLVNLSSFSIGVSEVTQQQWLEVMGSWPGTAPDAEHGVGNTYPAYNVSYTDALAFITKLNQMTGQTYRLPTEAEWEYAAREGSSGRGLEFSGANYTNIGNVAWYTINSGNKTHEVRTRNGNQLGIYDMTGNLWEWCSDWFDVYTSSDQINPQGPATANITPTSPYYMKKVRRGGSYDNTISESTVCYRLGEVISFRHPTIGFRVARTAQ
jgi:formylglycine-generating enzyme required for sulfatase activity